MICVVIPYFQAEAGILRRALASVAAQKNCLRQVHVMVIDDASPAPAGPEIQAVVMPAGMTTAVITQPNAGPGAARNTGLDHVPRDTRYIAFLDSDDEWAPDHLARATCALSQGFDFYFADLYQLGQTVSAFARASRIRPSDHPTLSGPFTALHAFNGDMFDQIIRGNVVGTPTVVYDYARHGIHRFKTNFLRAGEDYLFWMTIAHSNAKFAFSSVVGATCGRGVNVYSGAGWGTEHHLRRIQDELRYRKTIGKLFSLDARQRSHVALAIRDLRAAFARDLIHRIRSRKPTAAGLVVKQLRLDPLTLLRLPIVAMSTFWRRMADR